MQDSNKGFPAPQAFAALKDYTKNKDQTDSKIVVTKRINGVCSGYFVSPTGRSEFKMDQAAFDIFVGQWNSVAMGQRKAA